MGQSAYYTEHEMILGWMKEESRLSYNIYTPSSLCQNKTLHVHIIQIQNTR